MAKRGQSPDAKGHFYHVIHKRSDHKWHVKEVKGPDIGTYDVRDEAIRKASELAQNVVNGHVVIHRDDGRFEAIQNF